jgi:OmpA-like transmembrane domain
MDYTEADTMDRARIVLPALTALLLLAALALAPRPVQAGDSPWYVAAKLGVTDVEQNFGPRVLGWRVDDGDSSAAVEVGYQFHPNFALQAGYRDLGSYPGRVRPCPRGDLCPLTLSGTALIVPVFPRQADFSAVTLAAVPRWPITDRASLYGKLGALFWQSDLERTQGNPAEEPSGTDLLAGVGGHYEFPSGLGLLVEYEASDLMSALSAGVSWRF